MKSNPKFQKIGDFKICSKCEIQKQIDNYHKHTMAADGYSSWCKQCKSEIAKKWFILHAERRRKLGKDRYKQKTLEFIYRGGKSKAKNRGHKAIADWMTYNEFVTWYNSQIQECAVCKIADNLTIDHCHETGKPRGILCQSHNKAEGYVGKFEYAYKLYIYMKNNS